MEKPGETSEPDDADAHPTTPGPADVGLTVEQLERSRGAVRPNGNVSANVQATWNSTVGTPVHLAGHAGPFAAVGVHFSTGAVRYTLCPLLAPSPGGTPDGWGKRRQSKFWADAAPAEIPLDGIACRAADGTPYVFGCSADYVTVEAARGEWMEWDAERQAAQDVADTARAAKAVPA